MLIAALLLATTGLAPLPALASAADDLAAINQRRLKAFTEGNPDALVADFTEDAVFTSLRATFRVEGKAAIRAFYAELFQESAQRRSTSRQVATRFYANETVAISNGYSEVTLVDKAGVPHHYPTRFTLVYVKVDGRWLVAEYHNSATPGPY